MIKKILFTLFSIICVCMFSSCATMKRWSDSPEKNEKMYTVFIDSRTKGLPVYYTEKGVEKIAGVTPCYIYSDKAKIKFVTIKNEDVYHTMPLKTKLRTSTIWNVLPGPLFIWGFFADGISGRSVVYSQKEYFVDL